MKEIRIFWNHEQHLEVVLLFLKKITGIEEHPGCSRFSQAEDHGASDTRWLLYKRSAKLICKELPSLLQTLSPLRESS